MDTDLIKALLSTQEQAYRGAVEMLFKQTNDNVRLLQTTVNELTTSLEFTQREVEDLKKELKQCKEDKKKNEEVIEKLQGNLHESQETVKELEERANYMEDYSRRKNLQVVGLEESSVPETWEQTSVKVTKMLEEKLQLPNIELDRCHRIGQRNEEKPRTIVARFAKFGDREAVMRNVNKLKGTQIYINEDLCPASQSIRRAQLPMLKQARSEGKIAYFRGTKLVIKAKPAVATSGGWASRAAGRGVSLGSSSGGSVEVEATGEATADVRLAPAQENDGEAARTPATGRDTGRDTGRNASPGYVSRGTKTMPQRSTRTTRGGHK